MRIDIHEGYRKTSLSDLRDIIGWDEGDENVKPLLMVLCQRLERLQDEVEGLKCKVASLESYTEIA